MTLWQQYLQPKTLSEALDAFANAPRPLVPIAGGTDLLIDLQQGRHSPVHTLIDVTSIAEMTALELRGDELFIGASVPVNRIVLDASAVRHARALVEADLKAGVLVSPGGKWNDIFVEAVKLAELHTGTIGCRSLDILHCTAAKVLAASEFISTDARQKKLAAAIGLNLVTF